MPFKTFPYFPRAVSPLLTKKSLKSEININFWSKEMFNSKKLITIPKESQNTVIFIFCLLMKGPTEVLKQHRILPRSNQISIQPYSSSVLQWDL